jgi:FkbM family methyltransferase
MSPRTQLVLVSAFLLLFGACLFTYFVFPRPSSAPAPLSSQVPPYDGREPFVLKVEGMPGLKMYLDPTDRVITETILRMGIWEPTETYWFLRTVKAGDTIVDAGANMGYYTLIGSRLVGAEGRVYAIDQDPTNFTQLQKNVQLNRLTNVVLERKALSNRNGILKLFIADRNKGDHRIYQPDGESRSSIAVQAVRLDDYFKDYKRGIDFLKMDTQGAEGVILEGMTRLLERRGDGPTIFMEFWPHGLNGMGTNAASLLKTLQSYKYKFYEFNRDDAKDLRAVEPLDLLAAHPVNKFESQTDLMLLREGRERPQQ